MRARRTCTYSGRPKGLASMCSSRHSPGAPPLDPFLLSISRMPFPVATFTNPIHEAPMSSTPHPIEFYIPTANPRPRKDPADLRNRRIVLPVSSAEYDRILRLSLVHGCTLAGVLRSAIESIRPPVGDRPALTEIRRLAINVNQFLQMLHRGLPVESAIEPLLNALLTAVEGLRREIQHDQQKN